MVARLNDLMSEAAASEGVLLLDVARASEVDGIGAWFDAGAGCRPRWKLRRRRRLCTGTWSLALLPAQRGLSKKCLVLDLDNTLWSGVVGDDGSRHCARRRSAAGEAHLALQRYACS